MLTIMSDDPLAVAVTDAIRDGHVEILRALLADNPRLATARIVRPAEQCRGVQTARSLLHLATDWPGHYPNTVATITTLIAAGADVNSMAALSDGETPLHWAASCDDVSALDALLDHGAPLEAPGGVIGGGTPLADAVAFGQWLAARRLIARGAQANLWQAAALGLVDRVNRYFDEGQSPSRDDITNAMWCACHGGQQHTAEILLGHGADLNWIGHDQLTPLDAARRSEATALAEWLVQQGAKSADDMRR